MSIDVSREKLISPISAIHRGNVDVNLLSPREVSEEVGAHVGEHTPTKDFKKILSHPRSSGFSIPAASLANACRLIDSTQKTSVKKDGRNFFIWLIAIAIILN